MKKFEMHLSDTKNPHKLLSPKTKTQKTIFPAMTNKLLGYKKYFGALALMRAGPASVQRSQFFSDKFRIGSCGGGGVMLASLLNSNIFLSKNALCRANLHVAGAALKTTTNNVKGTSKCFTA